MKKTVIRQIIERLEDAQKHIIANTDYANGYDGALSDAVTVCESFLEIEKIQIMDAQKSGRNYKDEDGSQYYRETFGDNHEAGI